MKQPAPIEFDSGAYRRSHMKEPRGRGCWAFATYPNAAAHDAFFSPSLTYTEAKQWAKGAVVKHLGRAPSVLFVLP